MPITSVYEFFGTLFGPIHSVFQNCSSLNLKAFTWNLGNLFFVYRFIHFCQINIKVDKMKKKCDHSCFYSYYNFIKCTCSPCAGFQYYLLILTLTYVKKVSFMGFYFWYLFSIDIDIIENYGHPLYIIVYTNQEFIFLHWKYFVFTNEKLVRKKIVGV